jgi:hypothetical protein
LNQLQLTIISLNVNPGLMKQMRLLIFAEKESIAPLKMDALGVVTVR